MLRLLYIYIQWSLRDDLYSIEEIDCLDINIMNKSLDIKRINLDGDNLLSFFYILFYQSATMIVYMNIANYMWENVKLA